MLDKIERISRSPDIVRNRFRRMIGRLGIDVNYSNGVSFYPHTVCLIPTLRCNLDCIMCGLRENLAVPSRLPTGTMFNHERTREEIIVISDRIAEIRPNVLIGGGEPTLYPYLPDIIERISKRHGLFSGIMTNGLLLAELMESLIDAGLIMVYVSIDGIGEVFDRVRGKGNFERFESALKQSWRIKSRKGSKIPFFTAVYTITPDNYFDIPRTAKWLVSLGITKLVIQHPVKFSKEMIERHNSSVKNAYDHIHWTWGGSLDMRSIDPKLLGSSIAEAKKILSPYGKNAFEEKPDWSRWGYESYYFGNMPPPVKRRVCQLFWRMTFIYPDGSVMPSLFCYFHTMGNLLDNTLGEIWNNEAYRFLRSRVKSNGWFKICDNCVFPHVSNI
ncbi:radical SAM protein [bacterium]|nr:radical SAM protein [candidate division CSSED10-310 bacterium]